MTHYIRILRKDDSYFIMAFENMTYAQANGSAELARRLYGGRGFRHATKQEYDDYIAERGNINELRIDE